MATTLSIPYYVVLLLGLTLNLLHLHGTLGKVDVNIFRPFKTIETSKPSTLRFNASEPLSWIQLVCSSSEPVQWIFDDQKTNVNRFEWTDRKIPDNIDVYIYKAWIQINNYTFKVDQVEPDTFICSSVGDPLDNIVTLLTSKNGNSSTEKPLQFVDVEVIRSEGIDQGFQWPITVEGASVKVNFSVVSQEDRGYHFFRCQLQDGTFGKVVFETCYNDKDSVMFSPAAYCANTLRKIKLAEIFWSRSYSSEPPRGSTWSKLDNRGPGVAACVDTRVRGNPKVAAIEYFYSNVNSSHQAIEFAWHQIVPDELISISSHRKAYYVNEKSVITCTVTRYGFSFDPVLAIIVNGSKEIEDKDFKQDGQNWVSEHELDLSEIGPGDYVVQCIAPVWNTTEWANKTTSFIVVIDSTPPYFEPPVDSIVIQGKEGVLGFQLVCAAKGTPIPSEYSWSVGPEAIKTEARQKFNVTADVIKRIIRDEMWESKIICTATNPFGESASKTFKIVLGWLSDVSTKLSTEAQPNATVAREVLTEIATNVQGQLYNGSQITSIVNLVNTALTLGVSGNRSQETSVRKAVGVFNTILDDREAWTSLSATDKAEVSTNLLNGTEQALLQTWGNSQGTHGQNMTSTEVQIRPIGPLQAVTGIADSPSINENLENSSLKLYFTSGSNSGTNSSTVDIGRSADTMNSILLPKGWKQLVATENRTIPYVGTTISSDVAQDIFPTKTIVDEEEERNETGLILNSDTVSFSVGSFSGQSVTRIKLYFPGKGVEIEFSNRILASGYCGNVKQVALEAAKPHSQEAKRMNISTATCVYWEETEMKWSTSGCRRLSVNSTHTVCECSHLTAFSVLMKPFAHELEADHSLDVLTRILCPISTICLLLSIWVLSTVKLQTANLQAMSRLTLHLCLCLTIANLMIFLFLDHTIISMDTVPCYLSGVITHYFLLSGFGLMLLEGIHLYKLTVQVFQNGRNYTRLQFALVYGLPVLIVALTALMGIANGESAYGNDTFCWLNGHYIVGFMLPVGLVLVVNLCLLSVALHHARRRNRQFTSASKRVRVKPQLNQPGKGAVEKIGAYLFWTKSVFALSMLLGVTWIFGLFLLFCNDVISQVAAFAFTILNASQGIFILLFHCIGNTNIRNELKKKIQSWAIFKEFSTLLGSTASSSAETQNAKPVVIPLPLDDEKYQ